MTAHPSLPVVQDHASPHATSRGFATDTPATATSAAEDGAASRTRTSTAVPASGTEKISHRSAMRWTAPSPTPLLPPVEYPSRRACSTLAMPGPRSRATISRAAPGAGSERTSSSPPPACRARLVASSVTIRATLPVSLSAAPKRSASVIAARRAAPTWELSWTGRTRLAVVTGSLPPRDGDPGAFARARFDGELVHQSPSAAQTEAQPAARGEPIFERQLDVRDARPLILAGEAQPAANTVGEQLHPRGAAPAVLHRVPGQLAGGRDDLGLIDQAEAGLDRPLPHPLSHPHDVVRAADLEQFIPLDRHRSPRGRGRGPPLRAGSCAAP